MNEASTTEKILDNLGSGGGMDVGFAKSVIPYITTYGELIVYILCFALSLAFTVSVILNIMYVINPALRNIVNDIIEDDNGISRKLLSISCKAGREACERAYVKGGRTAFVELLIIEVINGIKIGLILGIAILGANVIVGLIEGLVEPMTSGGEVLKI